MSACFEHKRKNGLTRFAFKKSFLYGHIHSSSDKTIKRRITSTATFTDRNKAKLTRCRIKINFHASAKRQWNKNSKLWCLVAVKHIVCEETINKKWRTPSDDFFGEAIWQRKVDKQFGETLCIDIFIFKIKRNFLSWNEFTVNFFERGYFKIWPTTVIGSFEKSTKLTVS